MPEDQPRGRLRAFWSDVRATFRETPQLGILILANLLSSFNAGILIPVLPLFFVFEKGFSFLQLGGLYSMIALATVGVQLLAGRFHALFGRRGVVLTLLLLSVVLFPLYLVVDSILAFALVTAARSMAGAAAGPGLQVLVAQATPPQRRASVFAYFGVATSFSYAAAVILGGFLLGLGYAVVFYVGTLISLLSFVAMAGFILQDRLGTRAMPRPDDLAPEERAMALELQTVRHDLRVARSRLARARLHLETRQPTPFVAVRNVRWASLYLFLFGASLAIYPVYFPQYLVSQGLPTAWVGAVVAASWITFGLAQPWGGRYADRTGRHVELIVASLAAAALLNLVMGTTGLVWIIAAWIVLGIADGVGRPVTSALIVLSVTRPALGGAFGLTSAADTLARVVAPYGLAFVIQEYGTGDALVVVAFAVALAAVPILFMRRLPLPSAPAPTPQPTGGAA